MVEKKQPGDAVKNVFKNGRMPTKEEYTKDFYWKKVFVKPVKQKKSED